jgi:ABC-type xylose transport system permease subunit
LLFVVYVAIGAVIAYTHHYWENIHTIKAFVSALLATLLWPLLLLGVNLHIH